MKTVSRRASTQAGVKLTMEACCIMFSVKPEMEKNPDGARAVSLLTPSTRLVFVREGAGWFFERF